MWGIVTGSLIGIGWTVMLVLLNGRDAGAWAWIDVVSMHLRCCTHRTLCRDAERAIDWADIWQLRCMQSAM